MQLPYLSKLKNTVKWFIDATAPGAILKSPEANAVVKAEAVQQKLDRLESVGDPAKRAKVVAEAATTLASVKPRTLSQANELNQTLVTALDALKTEMVAGASPHTEDVTDDSPFDELGLAAAGDAAAIAQLKEMFAEAGLVFPPLGAAGVHKGYLKRQIEFKAKSGAFGAEAAVATAGAADVLTIRTSAIELPPTNEEILAVYESLKNQPERRSKFYAANESAIHQAMSDRKHTEETRRRRERAEEQLKASKAAAEAKAARDAANRAECEKLQAEMKTLNGYGGVITRDMLLRRATVVARLQELA